MRRFVLVHGAWHGAWCWARVAARLRAAGHEVVIPTLTGVGERAGELAPHVGLAAHVEDALAVLDEARPAVLVGHSYGGLVVREAADRRPRAVAHLVLVDGWAGPDGASMFDLAPAGLRTGLRRVAHERGDGWRMPAPDPATVGVTDPADAAWLRARLTAHPLRSFEDPTRLEGAVDAIPATAVLCRPSSLPFEAWAAAAGAAAVDLESGHDAMVTVPGRLTELLCEAAAGAGGP